MRKPHTQDESRRSHANGSRDPIVGVSPSGEWQPRTGLSSARLCCFGLSILKNLELTIKFYEDCVGSNAAIQLVAKDRRVLNTSLENRLKPRFVECQEAGTTVDTGTVMRIAKCTELSWSNDVMIFQKNQVLKEQLQGR
jgi:hypothetical protein